MGTPTASQHIFDSEKLAHFSYAPDGIRPSVFWIPAESDALPIKRVIIIIIIERITAVGTLETGDVDVVAGPDWSGKFIAFLRPAQSTVLVIPARNMICRQ